MRACLTPGFTLRSPGPGLGQASPPFEVPEASGRQPQPQHPEEGRRQCQIH